ncbi:MAG: ABC transporter substrate-binding protein [Burkholderiales bacterium]
MAAQALSQARALCALCDTLFIASGLALAEKKYGPGVSDTEIKLGQTMPYSGTASAYGVTGKTQLAYFKMLNEQGGINGRKINLISLDDGYSPPRTVEQVRKLVEEDQVLALFHTLGTPTNSAIHKYVNAKKVPHLFVSSGATKWGDPKNFPWTIGFNPSYQTESKIYAKYILQNKPDAKIAVLYQNDDSGKDYLKGFKDGLGSKANMIVAEASYESTDATVDSQVITLKACGDDLFRENVMRQATRLRDVTLGATLPGIKLNTGPEDYFLIEQLQPARFDGKRWVLFSDVTGHE